MNFCLPAKHQTDLFEFVYTDISRWMLAMVFSIYIFMVWLYLVFNIYANIGQDMNHKILKILVVWPESIIIYDKQLAVDCIHIINIAVIMALHSEKYLSKIWPCECMLSFGQSATYCSNCGPFATYF